MRLKRAMGLPANPSAKQVKIAHEVENFKIAIKKNELGKFAMYNFPLVDSGRNFDCVAAFFDLQGFTRFCDQAESYLSSPFFMEAFINWLFLALVKHSTRDPGFNTNGRIFLWAHLPFFWKFTGDGALFLWNLDILENETNQDNSSDNNDVKNDLSGNIVNICHKVIQEYGTFYRTQQESNHNNIPARLRCGIARGAVTPLPYFNDCIGSPINIASRLQKVRTLSFVIRALGIPLNKCFNEDFKKLFITRRLKIRGISVRQAVLLIQNEFDQLSHDNKKLFKL